MVHNSNNRGSLMITIMIITLFIFSTSVTAQPGKVKKDSKIHSGKLLQMFKSGGYTYLEYESDGKKFWAASKMVVANAGNIIEFRDPLVMKGFYSKTLKKKFDLIYFAGLVKAVGKTGPPPMSSMQSMMGHKKMGSDKKVITIKPGSVKRADKGVIVSECFAKKKELEGKEIILRAIVVKVSMKIKGRNWVHIRDGSGAAGSNDITFTTKEILSPGDQIKVKGKLVLNKDIGSGYVFPVFMEDPEITKEK
ncbi:MAG: hypothetical protein ABFR36_03330 [Acidobacteriota bacterium]